MQNNFLESLQILYSKLTEEISFIEEIFSAFPWLIPGSHPPVGEEHREFNERLEPTSVLNTVEIDYYAKLD